MCKRFFLFLLLLIFVLPSYAQTDSAYTKKYLERSTKFAWLTLGGDFLSLPGGTTQFIEDGTFKQTSFGSTAIPRLTIGGIHFWGHADFYVTFPISFVNLQDKPDVFSQFNYQHGIETGARVYPLKLKPNRIRPFAGVSFRTLKFNHEVKGSGYENGTPSFEKVIVPIQLGLTYSTPKYLISVSSYYQFEDEIEYYISPIETGTTTLSPFSFNVSFLKYLDIDRNARSKRALEQFNKMHHILEKENRLSTWYLGIGPSAALQTSKSPFLEKEYPFLYDDYSIAIMPDLTFGRYFHKPDMNVGLSYRLMFDKIEGFNTKISTRRHSLMLESYKFLFNWLGFVPFAGVTASAENLSTQINGERFSVTKPALGFVFGWDIRVIQTGTSLLRTNLRYIPNLHMDVNGEKMMFDHLEFNFIQWVYFFGRSKAYAKHRKKR